MLPSFADSPEFQRLLNGNDDVNLVRVALEIGLDAYPDMEIEAYLDKIEGFADRARSRIKAGSKVPAILGQINWVLFVEEEFRGNREHYDDPRNSYLNEVLDRGLGIPITLSLVYQAVAERLNLTMPGVNLPLHFMLRINDGGQSWFVDPFHRGAVYDRRGCEVMISKLAKCEVTLPDASLESCSSRVLISRVLRNLKVIYTRAGEIASLLPIQRRLTALNNDEPIELRDLGVLCVQANRLAEAIEPLESYLKISSNGRDVSEITDLLQAIRRELARWN
jgi:regulator of sirC expression with transglutaminase-like and TPR domain